MSKPYIYEFLFRGRPEGSAEPAAWHVIIGQTTEVPGSGEQLVTSGALTPEKAEAAGFSLSSILSGIETRAMAERDAAATEAAAARQERDAVIAERDAAKAETKAAQETSASYQTAAAQAAEERDALRLELSALTSRIAETARAQAQQDAKAAISQQPAQAVVLVPISDRQFFQALAQAGTITQAEALAAVMTGTLPARIETAVAGLPDDQQFAARMMLSGATTFERGHPMVEQLGAALGYEGKALDELWAAAAAL
ncbi:hypothetical protein [Methylobacterium aquaticum]|uniref:Uncharacterized protein n=1 Tax=Methylobacterium aquaticum TaxID=270351 RepID=A0A0C6FC30_9HYPH|nr:hypothetical protein [Methylobacterium aquaticum]BAQ44412.1 hypothetical protein Maq22A_c05110 [Methylobacterium aquaticum]